MPIPDNPYEEAYLCKTKELIKVEEKKPIFDEFSSLIGNDRVKGNQYVTIQDLVEEYNLEEFKLVNPDHDQG